MSSVVRLMRTGPRKLPALPQPSGSSLPSRALLLSALYRHLRAKIPAHDLLIIPQNHDFFKCRAPDFCKNRAKTATFFKHLTQKAASAAAFFVIKRPGACTSVASLQNQETHGCVYAQVSSEQCFVSGASTFGICTFSPVRYRVRPRIQPRPGAPAFAFPRPRAAPLSLRCATRSVRHFRKLRPRGGAQSSPPAARRPPHFKTMLSGPIRLASAPKS